VLADENLGKKGDAIIQPGRFDHGKKPADTVGALDQFVRLRKTTPNHVDCAIATIKAALGIDATSLAGLGKIHGVASSALSKGMKVHKVGRTTATTAGRVTAIELGNVVISYDIGKLPFDNQIEI